MYIRTAVEAHFAKPRAVKVFLRVESQRRRINFRRYVGCTKGTGQNRSTRVHTYHTNVNCPLLCECAQHTNYRSALANSS